MHAFIYTHTVYTGQPSRALTPPVATRLPWFQAWGVSYRGDGLYNPQPCLWVSRPSVRPGVCRVITVTPTAYGTSASSGVQSVHHVMTRHRGGFNSPLSPPVAMRRTRRSERTPAVKALKRGATWAWANSDTTEVTSSYQQKWVVCDTAVGPVWAWLRGYVGKRESLRKWTLHRPVHQYLIFIDEFP